MHSHINILVNTYLTKYTNNKHNSIGNVCEEKLKFEDFVFLKGNYT